MIYHIPTYSWIPCHFFHPPFFSFLRAMIFWFLRYTSFHLYSFIFLAILSYFSFYQYILLFLLLLSFFSLSTIFFFLSFHLDIALLLIPLFYSFLLFFFSKAIQYQEILFLGKKNKNVNIHSNNSEAVREWYKTRYLYVDV